MLKLSGSRRAVNACRASWGRRCKVVVLIVIPRLNTWAKVLSGGNELVQQDVEGMVVSVSPWSLVLTGYYNLFLVGGTGRRHRTRVWLRHTLEVEPGTPVPEVHKFPKTAPPSGDQMLKHESLPSSFHSQTNLYCGKLQGDSNLKRTI